MVLLQIIYFILPTNVKCVFAVNSDELIRATIHFVLLDCLTASKTLSWQLVISITNKILGVTEKTEDDRTKQANSICVDNSRCIRKRR